MTFPSTNSESFVPSWGNDDFLMLPDLPWMIHDFTFLKMIGGGGFSSVYPVQSQHFQLELYAQVMQLPSPRNDDEWKTAKNEIHVLTLLSHPNVVRIYDHFQNQTHFFSNARALQRWQFAA
jgi:serine/threonine protein kinase